MKKHEKLILEEQKYVGIKTTILFKEHDEIDFAQLHQDVFKADIKDIDHNKNFMAMDTDFKEESFSYTPLVPVSSYDNNRGFTHFTRAQGLYYAFDVTVEDLNPAWFKKTFEYIDENKLKVEDTGYDLEYFAKDYNEKTKDDSFVKELKILLKRKG